MIRWGGIFYCKRSGWKDFHPNGLGGLSPSYRRDSVAVNVNNEVGPFFQPRKELRQGDPLSPILFNIVADMLTLFINRAKADNQLGGVVPHLIEGGLSILQYANDTILFLEHNLKYAHNLGTILCAFEQLLGLKINFHKSEIYCFGDTKNMENEYMEMFGCNTRIFRIRYLGILVHYRKLSNNDWLRVQDRFENSLSSWKGKTFQLEAV